MNSVVKTSIYDFLAVFRFARALDPPTISMRAPAKPMAPVRRDCGSLLNNIATLASPAITPMNINAGNARATAR